MQKRLVTYILLSIMLLSVLVPNSVSEEGDSWWYDWPYRQEIEIPIDTSLEHAKYQPIDRRIEFEDPCWAKNELEHSLRVIFQDGDNLIELESQIYDLNHTDEKQISSCDIVFLIPKAANGEEKYFVYYDEKERPSPNYPKRVDVSEIEYSYSPFTGYSFQAKGFQINQGDEIVYGINKEGETLGEKLSQEITKINKDAKEIRSNSAEHAVSLNFVYWWLKNGKFESFSTSQKFKKKQIITNGNLLVKLGIVSQSDNGMIQSTVIYKYYYCPTENKRIHTHVKHEVLNNQLPTGEQLDLAFCTFPCGSIRSSSIEELNFGEIQPFLHFYSEEGRIRSEELNQNPDSEKWEWIIRKKDNYDLGSPAWVSADYGETDKAHAIIIESNNILKSGEDERDGIELQSGSQRPINLPGLIARTVITWLMRNDFEEGESYDTKLPDNYVVEFNAEYFTTENGGFPAVAKEAELYQKLVSYQPADGDDVIDDEDEDEEKYSLTAYAHLAPSFPLGSVLSAVTGKNFPYIYAELYKENSYKDSGSVGRIPLKGEEIDFKDKNFLELISTVFDWKNSSIFKKIHFEDLTKGRYLIKIYLKNPIIGDEKRFIGYQIVDLDKDTKVHIFCKKQGKVNVFLNPNNEGVENAQVYLMKEGLIISEGLTDSSGKATVTAPCGLFEKYELNVTYKGFLISNEQIRLGRIRALLPLRKTYNFDVHDLKIDFRDSKGAIPSFDVDLELTSDEMDYPVYLAPDRVNDGVYYFDDLYPADYSVIISYNQFKIIEKLNVPTTSSFEIKLYNFSAEVKDSWNLYPDAPLDVSFTSLNFEKNGVMSGNLQSQGKYEFSNLYPGLYLFKVSYKSYTIEEEINVPSGKLSVIFPAEFDVTQKILDNHGSPLSDAKVIMRRNGIEVNGISNDNGEVVFTIPPGTYETDIYHDDSLIAKRNIMVLNHKSLDVVTAKEPIFPLVVMLVILFFVVGAAIISYRKKDVVFFLKILAVALAIIAIVSPWWAISGSSNTPHLEASTKLYLVPTEMVTIISNNNVSAGELGTLHEDFTEVIALFPIAITVSIFCILANLVFTKYNLKKSSFLTFLLSLLFFIGSNIIFFIAMSTLGEVTVGNFMGSGILDYSIPGEKMSQTISSSWGPDIGFYLLLGSAIVLILAFLINLRKILLDRKSKD